MGAGRGGRDGVWVLGLGYRDGMRVGLDREWGRERGGDGIGVVRGSRDGDGSGGCEWRLG